MAGFEVFRIPRNHPFPTTMRTALRAFRLGFEGPEAFYFRATSVDSIHKRPLDAVQVKELLVRSGHQVRQNMELSHALFGGLVEEDRDLADFAAQALTRIENRYQEAIKGAQKRLSRDSSEEALRELARYLLDFAEIEWFDRTLSSFYIGRAIELLKERHATSDGETARLLLRAELLRDNLEGAEAILETLSTEGDQQLLLLQAELAFRRRDLEEVRRVMDALAELPLDERVRDLVRTWSSDEESVT